MFLMIWRHLRFRLRRTLFPLWVLTSFSCAAQQTLNISYIEFAPSAYTDEHGRPAGRYLTFLIKLVEQAGYRWVAKPYPTKRLYDSLLKGTVDVYVGPATVPILQNKVWVSKMPIGEIELRIYAIGDTPLDFKREDLIDKNVIIVRGLSYSDWGSFIYDHNNHIHVLEARDHLHALKMLKAGRAKYLFGYRDPIREALKQLAVENLQYNTLYVLDSFIIVSKKTPNAEAVLTDLVRAYELTDPQTRPGFREPSEPRKNSKK